MLLLSGHDRPFFCCAQVSDLKKRTERSRKELFELQMTAEQEVILYRQELVTIREALRSSEVECQELRTFLEKEVCRGWRKGRGWGRGEVIDIVYYLLDNMVQKAAIRHVV